jgi:hypothetical protein
MATATTLRAIAAQLEARVSRRGCGCESCYCADYCADIEGALLPAPEVPRAESPNARPATVRRTGEHLAVKDAIARQEAVFDSQLPCY